LSLDRTVAVKRLRDDVVPDTPGGHRQVERFRREVMTTAALEHPNIIPVYDAGEDKDGHPQLAMKLVRGTTWSDMLDEDRELPRTEFFSRHLPILTDVAQAVSYAHSRGVIHRDIKPSQVLVGEFGEVLLVEWGLAFFMDGDHLSDARHLPNGEVDEVSEGESTSVFDSTATAVCPAGTPAYMAPEQTDEVPDRLGPWTDVYLLGGVLYFLLTGTHLREGSSAAGAFLMAARGEVEAPSRRAPGMEIPDDLEVLALAALSLTPEERPTALEFIAGIRDHLSGASRRRESVRLTGRARSGRRSVGRQPGDR
jgi:serine/threonine protein kinase